MDESDKIAALDDDLTSLEGALDDASAMTSSFSTQLRSMQGAMSDTTRDLGNLERGFSSGLRGAFDDAVLGGESLQSVLTGLAQSMSNTVYDSAVTPVTDQLGSFLSDGVNSLVSSMMPFADGAAFSQGRVMPFAKGGVVSSPTAFPMSGGTGLMGEAGPEAIMPLTRGADGSLGVRSSGGAPVTVNMNITTPDAQSFQRSNAQIAAQMDRAVSRAQRHK